MNLGNVIKRINALGINPLVGLLFAASLGLAVHITAEILEGEGGGPDRAILLALRKPDDLGSPIGPRWLLQSVIDISALGGTTVIALFTAATACFLALVGRWRAFVILLLAVVGASVLSSLVKFGIHRDRPMIVPHLAEVSSQSFPSGHAMVSAATYLTLGALLAQSQRSRKVKVFLLSVAVTLTILIGLSRLYLGVHWPSDVLAGWSFGAAWALMFWLIARKAEA